LKFEGAPTAPVFNRDRIAGAGAAHYDNPA